MNGSASLPAGQIVVEEKEEAGETQADAGKASSGTRVALLERRRNRLVGIQSESASGRGFET